MNTKFLGRWGESLAANYLRKKGYKIVGMGYNTRMGEVDIIAENKKFIAFVEVKLRKRAAIAEAREYVDAAKQKRVISTAQMWLSENETEKQPRFDVIEIYAPDGTDTKKPEITHLENAFW